MPPKADVMRAPYSVALIAAGLLASRGEALKSWMRAILLAAFFIVIGSPRIWGQTADATSPAQAGGSPLPAAATSATGTLKIDRPPPKEPLPVSLFFSAEEKQQIRMALEAYEKSKTAKATAAETKASDFLNQLTTAVELPKEAPKEETTYVYPQFFLNSIVYHAADDWVVLVNNQRFSSHMAEEDPELKILEVDDEKVLLEWKPKNMKKVKESWLNARNDSVNVDMIGGNVTFTLRPNQTFSSYVMRVVEGKVRPVVIKMVQDDQSGDHAKVLPVNASANAAIAPKDNAGEAQSNKKIENLTTDDIKKDEGPKALDNTYKKMGLEN